MRVLLHVSTLCLCPTVSASHPLRTVYTCIVQLAACKQHPCLSNIRPWFCQLLVIYGCLDQVGAGVHILGER